MRTPSASQHRVQIPVQERYISDAYKIALRVRRRRQSGDHCRPVATGVDLRDAGRGSTFIRPDGTGNLRTCAYGGVRPTQSCLRDIKTAIRPEGQSPWTLQPRGNHRSVSRGRRLRQQWYCRCAACKNCGTQKEKGSESVSVHEISPRLTREGGGLRPAWASGHRFTRLGGLRSQGVGPAKGAHATRLRSCSGTRITIEAIAACQVRYMCLSAAQAYTSPALLSAAVQRALPQCSETLRDGRSRWRFGFMS